MTREEMFAHLNALKYITDESSMMWLALDKAIKALQQEWTLISEKSPTENGWYMCTVVVPNNQQYVMDLFYKNGKWLDNRRIDMFNTYDIYGYGCSRERHKLEFNEFMEFDWTENVIAWQENPEPYKAESEDKDAHNR